VAQIVFTREEMDRVKALFDSVKSNGQALAVVDRTIKMATDCWASLQGRDSAYAAASAKDLTDMSKPVRDARASLAGSPTSAVGKTWTDLRPKVMNLWNYVRVVQMGLPPGEDLGDGFNSAIKSAAADLPATIGNAAKVTVQAATKVVKVVAKTAGEVGAAVGGAAGSILWATLKPLLPLVLILGVGGAAYLYATRKGLI
jgi:hypothetical protein